MNSSSSFGPERDADRGNGYDSDGLFNGAAANSAAHHSSNHGLAGEPPRHTLQHPKSKWGPWKVRSAGTLGLR